MRGRGGLGGAGIPIGGIGGGAGLLLLLLVVLLNGGLPGGGSSGGPLDPFPTVASPQAQPGEPQTNDNQTEFVYFVTNDVQNTWEDIFKRAGEAVPAHDAAALQRPGQHGLRRRLVGDRAVLLPARPARVPRHDLLPGAEEPLRRRR